MSFNDVAVPAWVSRLGKDHRGFPLIASISRSRDVGNFAKLSEVRKLIIGAFDLCGLCGRPFNGEAKYSVLNDNTSAPLAIEAHSTPEPPMHLLCAMYGVQVCPFLVNSNARRKTGPAKGAHHEQLWVVGFAETSQLVETTRRLSFQLTDRVDAFNVDATIGERFAAALAGDTPAVSSLALERVMGLLQADDSTLGGLCWCAIDETAHAHGIKPSEDLATLRTLAKSLSARNLPSPSATAHPETSQVICAWLDECDGNLPPFVASSRTAQTAALSILGDGSTPRSGRPGRNDRCPCGSSLKYKRCHGAT